MKMTLVLILLSLSGCGQVTDRLAAKCKEICGEFGVREIGESIGGETCECQHKGI